MFVLRILIFEILFMSNGCFVSLSLVRMSGVVGIVIVYRFYFMYVLSGGCDWRV